VRADRKIAAALVVAGVLGATGVSGVLELGALGVSVLGVGAIGVAGCRMTSPPTSAPASSQSVGANGGRALRGPFDVEGRRARIGRPMPDSEISAIQQAISQPISQPIFDVQGVSFYTDAEKSVADPVLKQQNLDALKPLRTFVDTVVKLTDGWVQSNPPQPAYAVSAVESLWSWATAGALLGTVNHQGEFEREWTLGSLALAYLKVRDAPGLDPGKRQVIESWLRRIARVVQPDYERMNLKASSNNHAYWTGMAVAAAGIACDDRDLFDWGISRARIGIAQVQPDGILPLERDRRSLALHYHVFALAPLVMLAELASANGIALYAEGDGAIRRLANLVIAGLADPVSFGTVAAAGSQEINLPPRKTDLAWAEPYFARFRDQRLTGWMIAARPLYDVRLGGDVTAAFGVPLGDRL
jgi:poly(beta-D-mannuronate) lyase